MTPESRVKDFITHNLFRYGRIGEVEMLSIMEEAQKCGVAYSYVTEVLMPEVYRTVDMREVVKQADFREFVAAELEQHKGKAKEAIILERANKVNLEVSIALGIFKDMSAAYKPASPPPIINPPAPDTQKFDKRLAVFFKNETLSPDEAEILYEECPLGLTEDYVTKRIAEKIKTLGLEPETPQAPNTPLKVQFMTVSWRKPPTKPSAPPPVTPVVPPVTPAAAPVTLPPPPIATPPSNLPPPFTCDIQDLKNLIAFLR